jgi:hypothetical protein
LRNERVERLGQLSPRITLTRASEPRVDPHPVSRSDCIDISLLRRGEHFFTCVTDQFSERVIVHIPHWKRIAKCRASVHTHVRNALRIRTVNAHPQRMLTLPRPMRHIAHVPKTESSSCGRAATAAGAACGCVRIGHMSSGRLAAAAAAACGTVGWPDVGATAALALGTCQTRSRERIRVGFHQRRDGAYNVVAMAPDVPAVAADRTAR